MIRKTAENGTRKLLKLGKSSLAVTLPKNILLELGWREKQNVTVKKQGKSVVITDWKE